jgi:triosephosphate isomerase
MFKTVAETVHYIEEFSPLVAAAGHCEIVLCPPFPALAAAAQAAGGGAIAIGAQNLHWEDEGAFTGEVSGEMIVAAGATHAIVGHSERRQYFGETDETVNKKVKQALAKGLLPILCVGETLAEREAGKLTEVISRQVTGGLKDIATEAMKKVVIAYEPVWAIGTGKTATPEQANEVHALIRNKVKSLYDAGIAEGLRIQYGGSVTPDNASTLMAMPDIDGALVGGASLKPESFAALVTYK